jgi:hypothetical protein
MVKPYLSRLRPAETGPGLRPRARSRFEPAPTLPIDGPSIASLGLSLPPAGAADVGIELDQDPPSPHPAGPVVAAATPGDRGLPSARIAGPERAAADERAAPDEERAPRHAVRAARPPRREPAPTAPPAADIKPHQDLSSPQLADPAMAAAAGGQGLLPRGTAVPERAPHPPRPSPAPASGPVSGRGRRTPTGDEGDVRPALAEAAGREHARAPWSATRRAALQPRQAPPEQPFVLRTSPERPGAQPTPPAAALAEHPPRAPYRQVDPMGRSADGPAGRVQAMARWLRDADAAARPEAASPSIGPRAAPPGRARDWPGPAVATEVTVTIGRIEVKAPAAASAPARPQPGGGPRQRVPSLGDYLESRTRVRGRPG